ncbi:hypothetical protein QQ73_10935, partial [Candidatus Endoriftia persephone str. Guaymas]|nr:hypothetical protein [Candidatus Endoriftia persephone str. Guaymas]
SVPYSSKLILLGFGMKKMLTNILLFLAAIGVTALFYALTMWLLDKGSEVFGRQSVIGDLFEKSGFWLSHLG